jgi:predicted nucleotidyltransferase
MTTAMFKQDIDRAVRILKEEGCTEIYLFGSVATGETHAESDIDLAVRGCPPGRFFQTLGRLLMELDRSVDLVDLDSADPFAEFLQQKRRLLRIV